MEKELSPGLGDRLAAIRAAVKWSDARKKPVNSTVGFFVDLRRRNPREFAAWWDRLEKEFEAGAKGEGEGVKSGGEVAGGVVEPLVSERVEDAGAEKVCEMLGEWLDRHKAGAEAKAAAMGSG